jgi:hypothetical protein
MRPGPRWGLGVALGATVILLASCGSGSSSTTAGGKTGGSSSTGSSSTGSSATASTAPAPSGPANCQTGQLQASRLATAAAAGNIVVTYGLHNVSDRACTLFGYPGLQMTDASGHALPTQVSHGGSYTFGAETPAPVLLSTQAEASFYLGYSDVASGSGMSCPQSARLEITPPNETGAITITDQIAPCGGAVTVSPVHAGTAPPS